MVKFAYTILYVQDVERSIQFYEKHLDSNEHLSFPEIHTAN
jgi:catechol 2,3-dioxygenase-like lactoylglutathione lyase family enzyme